MAQIRVCDRCKAPALPMVSGDSQLTVTLPAGDPSTLPVTVDVAVRIGLTVVSPFDLCPICQVSAFVEYALAELGAHLTPQILAALSLRINAALGFKAPAV